jgi:hypothetical protein
MRRIRPGLLRIPFLDDLAVDLIVNRRGFIGIRVTYHPVAPPKARLRSPINFFAMPTKIFRRKG